MAEDSAGLTPASAMNRRSSAAVNPASVMSKQNCNFHVALRTVQMLQTPNMLRMPLKGLVLGCNTLCYTVQYLLRTTHHTVLSMRPVLLCLFDGSDARNMNLTICSLAVRTGAAGLYAQVCMALSEAGGITKAITIGL